MFRRAYAALPAAHPGTAGDAAYLRLLPLAASTQEAEVQAALEWVLEAGQVPELDRVRELVRPTTPVVPALAIPAVELASYDALLGEADAMTDSLDRRLRELHLPTVLAQAQAVAIEAERSGWSFTRYLYTLAELELEERRQHRLQRRRKESGLPASKTLTTLQLAHLPHSGTAPAPHAVEGQFVEQAQNVLAFGLPGRGKTH